MAWKSVTLRKKFFGNVVGFGGKEPFHGHGMEYFVDVLGILVSIAFVIGCYCFASPHPEVFAIGDWLFIAASLTNVGISAHTLLEQFHAFKAQDPLKQSERDEVKETLLYLISAVLFALGCVFFMPGLEATAANNFIVAGLGAWLCIVGSFMVVMAVFYNAMGFSADSREHGIDKSAADFCVRLTRYGMFLLLFGGVFFAAGSFMYRPVFGGKCPPDSKNATCIAVRSFGTSLYLAGSYCFLAQTILTLIVGVAKHAAEDRCLHYSICAGDAVNEKTKLVNSPPSQA